MRYLQTALGPDIQDHLTNCRLGRTSSTTLDAKERLLARLAVSCPTVGIAELDYEHLERFLITVPEGSWRTYRSHINTFIRWAIRFDRRSAKNPAELLPKLRPNPSRVLNVFDEHERGLIIDASRYMDDPARDRVRAHLLLDAGIRKGEARGLLHGGVNPNRREIAVIGKNDKERVIPIEDDQFWLAWETALLTPIPRLKRLPASGDYVWFPMRIAGEYKGRARQVTRAYPDRPMGSRGFHEWWERLLGHAGVDYRKPHMTRHTYATDAIDASEGDIYGVKELLGHANIATTQLYLHSSRRRKDSVAAALARVRAGNSPPK
jgi:integrase/recombinase XerC